jgi:hypothetical protein
MSISNYLEDLILDKVFNNSDFTISNLFVSLHTADPGETGGNEVTGGSYARQPATFDPASGGVLKNDTDLTFLAMPACTVTHVGIWDIGAGGNLLWYGSAITPKVYGLDDTAVIYTNNLQITLD